MVKRIRAVGQALVEFALAATLIFLLLAATIDLGMILFILQGLHSAAQEGALYGSLMKYEDEDDKDDDGFEKPDIYYSKITDTIELEPVARVASLPFPGSANDESDPNSLLNESYYPDFLKQVRERVVFEAGAGGTTGFSNLHDLDDDGIDDEEQLLANRIISADGRDGWFDTKDSWEPNCDDWEEATGEKCRLAPIETRRDELIDINIENVLPTGTKNVCGDPMERGKNCQITVKVRARYELIFPLVPAFGDDIWLSSEYTMPMQASGVSRAGNQTVAYETTTPDDTEPTPTMTPTEEITTSTYCDTKLDPIDSNPEVAEDWDEGTVPLPINPDYAAELAVAGSTWEGKICSAGIWPDVTEEDNFHFLYQRVSGDEKTIFVARLTDWDPPVGGDGVGKMGIMVRNSTDPSTSFAAVLFEATKDGDRQIVFRYRPVDSGTIVLGATPHSITDAPEDTPIWMRLERAGSQIRASYSLEGTPNPVSDGDWTSLYQEGDWATLNGLSSGAGSEVMYGAFHVSGVELASDDQFAVASFDKITLDELDVPSPSLFFTVPIPGDNGPIHFDNDRGDSMTNFTVAVNTEGEDDDVEFESFVYRIFDNAGNQIGTDREYNGLLTCDREENPAGCTGDLEMLCPFGDDGSGNCNTMPDDIYEQLLLRRGSYSGQPINDLYTIYAEATQTEDGAPLATGQAEFYVDPPVINFASPAADVTADDGTAETKFYLEAYDPRYGTNNGDGIINVRYTINREGTPTSIYDYTKAYYDQDIRSNKRGHILCVFGSQDPEQGVFNPDDCNNWTSSLPEGDVSELDDVSELAYERLEPGTYNILARVLPRGGTFTNYESWGDDDRGPWSELVERSVTIPDLELTFFRNDSGWQDWPAGYIPEVDENGLARFKMETWAPHVGTDNGDGIEQISIEIYHEDDSENPVYSKTIDDSTDPNNTEPPFCVFDQNNGGNNCKSMTNDDFRELSSGKYKLVVKATNNKDLSEDKWVVGERFFEVPESGVYVDFLNDPENPTGRYDSGDTILITSRDMTKLRFQAYLDEDGRADEYVGNDDGKDIVNKQMEIEITYYDADGNKVGEYSIGPDADDDARYEAPTYNQANQPPLCVFGKEKVGGTRYCVPVDEDTYDSEMQSGGRVEIRVRARSKNGSQANGRYSNWTTIYLEIPPMLIRFVDPKPNPNDRELEEGPYDRDDNKKVIVTREDSDSDDDFADGTEFEFEAFAPKYAGDAGDCDISNIDFETIDPNDPEDLDDVDKDCWGVGIDHYEVEIQNPSNDRFYGYKDPYYLTYPDDNDDCNDEDLDTRCEDEERRLCVFGRDGDECKPMQEDEGDEDELAWESDNLERGEYEILASACEPGFCTDKEDTIAYFKIGEIFAEFDPPTERYEVMNVLSDTGFRLEARDPIGLDEDVLSVQFTLFNQVGLSIYTSEVYYTGLTNETPDEGGSYFCVFPDGTFEDIQSPCASIGESASTEPLSNTLTPGEYTIQAEVIALNGDSIEVEETFEVDIDMPIDLEFVSPLDNTTMVTITDVADTNFEAEASRGAGTPANGDGIKHVIFEINGQGTQILSPTADTSAPFCALGDDGIACNTLDSNVFDILVGGTYQVIATATAYNDETEAEIAEFLIPSFEPTFSFTATGGTNKSNPLSFPAGEAEWTVDVDSPLDIDNVSVRYGLWDTSGDASVLLDVIENTSAYSITGDSASFCLTTNDDNTTAEGGNCLKLDTPLDAGKTYAMTALVVYQDGDDHRRSKTPDRIYFLVE
jgi:hypothetical protein